MFSIHYLPNLNVGIYPIHILFGIVVAIFVFFAVVALEGRLMEDYFFGTDKYIIHYKRRFRFSLIINSISTVVGIPINYFLFRDLIFDHLFQTFIINFLLTLIIEYISVKIFIRSDVIIDSLMKYFFYPT